MAHLKGIIVLCTVFYVVILTLNVKASSLESSLLVYNGAPSESREVGDRSLGLGKSPPSQRVRRIDEAIVGLDNQSKSTARQDSDSSRDHLHGSGLEESRGSKAGGGISVRNLGEPNESHHQPRVLRKRTEKLGPIPLHPYATGKRQPWYPPYIEFPAHIENLDNEKSVSLHWLILLGEEVKPSSPTGPRRILFILMQYPKWTKTHPCSRAWQPEPPSPATVMRSAEMLSSMKKEGFKPFPDSELAWQLLTEIGCSRLRRQVGTTTSAVATAAVPGPEGGSSSSGNHRHNHRQQPGDWSGLSWLERRNTLRDCEEHEAEYLRLSGIAPYGKNLGHRALTAQQQAVLMESVTGWARKDGFPLDKNQVRRLELFVKAFRIPRSFDPTTPL